MDAAHSDLRDVDPRPVEEWLDAVRREERRGEPLAAFDLAEQGLAEHPDDRSLKHRAVLALARSGATDEAARRFADYGLGDARDEDIAALRARIAKDHALQEEGELRRRRAAHAADLYASVHARTGGYYPAINAATLWLLAGDAERSREVASSVLALIDAEPEDSYYAAATRAEAELLLGHEVRARESLREAAALHGGDYGALATTRRQLREICHALGLDEALLSPLAGPGVVYFCGHLISPPGRLGGFASGAEDEVASRIARVVRANPPGFAYGALAGGGDILWAEALLAHGSELHIVLPFAREEFVARSVTACGPGWSDRFERCLAAAVTVRYATDDAFLGDDVLFRYGGELAMGLALLRARYLDAEVQQLALWDGKPARGEAGTAIDVETWRATGHSATIVSPAGGTAQNPPPPLSEALNRSGPEPHQNGPGRVIRAMLFGDIRGFSKLTDEQLPRFAARVLGAFAEVIARHREHVAHRNTWGDAVYIVLSDVAAGGACALDLQAAMAAIELDAEGLPAHLALRLGGHVGPVFPITDPVLEEGAFMGSHVSRTARIEPVTPPGTVYVTEAFAAALMLAGEPDLTCDYVGHMAAAKGYGRLRMYRLRPTREADEPRA
jgi:class 3 adenylate cyclase